MLNKSLHYAALAFAGAVAFYDHYFADLRWGELATAVGIAFGSGVALAVSFRLPEKAQYWFGILVAASVAISFVRNPKRRDWVSRVGSPTKEPTSAGQSPDDARDDAREDAGA